MKQTPPRLNETKYNITLQDLTPTFPLRRQQMASKIRLGEFVVQENIGSKDTSTHVKGEGVDLHYANFPIDKLHEIASSVHYIGNILCYISQAQ